MLIIEDEPGILDFVERGLALEGHATIAATDGIDGEQLALAEEVDLVVLDRMLPGRDGLEVLAAIRARKPGLPVIVLSALSGIDDRVTGLDAGATDYLPKPFAFDELAARVRAHLRDPGPGAETRLSVAGIELDLLERSVARAGISIHLAAREFDLLAHFMRNPDRALSRPAILAAVWGYDPGPGSNLVDVYVRYLRQKLGRTGEPAPIDTLRGVGYRLRSDG